MRSGSRLAFVLVLTTSLLDCGSRDLAKVRQSYVQVENSGRGQTPVSEVHFLESEPKDRKFKVIGIIGPPDDLYESFGALVNALRQVAAERGADAIFLISEQEGSKWGFGADGIGAHGGSRTTHQVRAKAIVWVP